MPVQRPVIDYNGELSQAYEPGRSISPEAEQTWRAAVQPYVGNASTVVDVGAGTGRFTRLLADVVAGGVVAVEPASGMRAVAKQASQHRGLVWMAGTAEHLPVADASTDAVWTAFTTHYLDLVAAGREFRRVLHNDGYLLVWHAFEDEFDDIEWFRWFPSARKIDEERMPSFDQVAALFEAAGLELLQRSTHQMLIAQDMRELADRLAHRAISTLKLISDEQFDRGIANIRKFAETASGEDTSVRPTQHLRCRELQR